MSTAHISNVFLLKLIAVTILMAFFNGEIQSQTIWMNQDGNPSGFWRVDYCSCPGCIEEEWQAISETNDLGFTVTPSGKLYGINDFDELYRVDTVTGASFFLMQLPENTKGLCSLSDHILLSIKNGIGNDIDTLVEINLATMTVESISPLEYRGGRDMTLFNGEIYYIVINPVNVPNELVKVNLANPSDGILITTIPDNRSISAITAIRECNTLLGVDLICDCYVKINVVDGTITNFQDAPSGGMTELTSIIEFETIPCQVTLDLDCNDSSGAMNADYNSPEYNCVSDGVPIIDIDPLFFYDALIQKVFINMTGAVPDGANEFLELQFLQYGIEASGSGTQTITLTNEGSASSGQFIAAIRDIMYKNSATNPTPGLRTVEIFYTTVSGESTNTGTAFINVVYLAPYDLDLGNDIILCDGQTSLVDTELDDITYNWSTGANSQSILVTDPGIYSVTVSGDEFCEAQDSIEVTYLPVIHVTLQEDVIFCENEEIFFSIETDATFPITVQIIANPGGLISYSEITGDHQVLIHPVDDTYYSIDTVYSSQPACIEIGTDIQFFEILDIYLDTLAAFMCVGDSILINGQWIFSEGLFTSYFQSEGGCDSLVTTHVQFSDEILVHKFLTSCSLSDTGTFQQYIINPDGCDTILQSTVLWYPLDTTFILTESCSSADTGFIEDVFISIEGCDSLVITSVSYISPSDSTHLISFSCDSAAHGSFPQLYVSEQGCDSIVISHIVIGQPDTIWLSETSCDSLSLGIFEQHYLNQYSCDSLVITEVSYSSSDSTYIFSESCINDETGVFVQTFVNRFGCDSIVVEEITLIPEISTYISSYTCEAGMEGIFIDTFMSIQGCDSIVHETILLQPKDEIHLFSTTCLSSEAGVYTTHHINQYGCDSTITLTIDFEPSDSTFLILNTCDSSEIGEIETIYTSQNGCDSLVILQTELFSLPEVSVELLTDFNGYPVSCHGATDGSILSLVEGVEPYSYLWSNGLTDPNIDGLSAGIYTISVTDGNGCIASAGVVLTEPEEFSIYFTISKPDCFDQYSGQIFVEHTGGIEPVQYSLDGINFQSSPVFGNLSGGTYSLTAIDANQCEAKEVIWINVPVALSVDLGDDQVIEEGQSAVINAIINVPFDSIVAVQWTGILDPNCSNCLSQLVSPVITTTYSVYVTNSDGCDAQDSITLFVDRGGSVYVPNVFTPNGDNINDILMVSAGLGINEILEFSIFDRWGNIVFLNQHFQPNDPVEGWDGQWKDKDVNPAVFSYKLIIRFEDGREDVLLGDLTLIR